MKNNYPKQIYPISLMNMTYTSRNGKVIVCFTYQKEKGKERENRRIRKMKKSNHKQHNIPPSLSPLFLPLLLFAYLSLSLSLSLTHIQKNNCMFPFLFWTKQHTFSLFSIFPLALIGKMYKNWSPLPQYNQCYCWLVQFTLIDSTHDNPV